MAEGCRPGRPSQQTASGSTSAKLCPVPSKCPPIIIGGHSKAAYRLANERKAELESLPNAFFSVNVVARKPEKNRPDTNPYLKKFLKQNWQKTKNSGR